MPTLDELRRLLARGIGNTKPKDIREGVVDWEYGGEADHLDEFVEVDMPISKGVDLDKMKAARVKSPPRYVMDATGTDAIIKFGKHRDKTLRDIHKEEPTYLAWLLKEFRDLEDKASKDFVDIINLIIDGK